MNLLREMEPGSFFHSGKLLKCPSCLSVPCSETCVGGGVERHFPWGTADVSLSSRKYNIIRYIHSGLAGDAASGKIDERVEAEIVKKIPGAVSEV